MHFVWLPEMLIRSLHRNMCARLKFPLYEMSKKKKQYKHYIEASIYV